MSCPASRAVFTGVALCALCVALSAPLAAQDRSEPAFSATVDVRVVNVDVFVSDKKGNPIPNLQQKDFELFEDDKKVKVTNFYEVSAESREQPSIIVYVDETHLTVGNRRGVLETLLPFVERRISEAGAQVMAVRFDGLMHVEQRFTDDVELVRAAFAALDQTEPKISQSVALERATRNDMLQTMSMIRGGGGDQRIGRSSMDALFNAARGYAEAVRAETALSIDALSQVAGALGARPGRKSLYFVGDGLAMRPLGELVTTIQRQISGAGDGRVGGRGTDASEGQQMRTASALGGGENSAGVDATVGGQQNDTSLARLEQSLRPLTSRPQILQLGAIANASRVTMYPILPPIVDASTAGLGNRTSESQRPLSNMREALELMASSTGGQSMVAGKDISGFLSRTEEGGAARYSLGFVPKEATSGFHELRVKAKRGMRLRYRESYVAKTSRDLLADRAVGALTLGWIDNQHEVELKLDSETPAADGNFDVTVLMAFPISQLSLVEEGGIHSANCQVAIVVLNSLGQLTSPQFMDIPLQIRSDQLEAALAQHFGAKLNLKLPAGHQQVAIGLWDENGQKGSFVAHEFSVGGS